MANPVQEAVTTIVNTTDAKNILDKFSGRPMYLSDLTNNIYDNKYNNIKGDPKDFNIVDDYAWTLTPTDRRNKPPYIELIEHEQTLSNLYAQLEYWYTAWNPTDENPYENLYAAKETGTKFKLPYFEEYDHNIGQNWEKTKGAADFSSVDKVLNVASNIAKALQIAPGTTINQPQIWNGSAANSYTISFTLFNTIDSVESEKNIRFKRRLIMSSLHDQRSAILSAPPALFKVIIPGIRYSPAAIISQLSITNVGQINNINGENIPDAYLFNVQILELITESRQIYNASSQLNYNKITAFTKTDNKVIDVPPPEATRDSSGLTSSLNYKSPIDNLVVRPDDPSRNFQGNF